MKYFHNLPLSVRIAYAIWGNKPQMVFTASMFDDILVEFREVSETLKSTDNIFTRWAKKDLEKEIHAILQLRVLAKFLVMGEVYGTKRIHTQEYEKSSVEHSVQNEDIIRKSF
jgi:hypothetical protein